MNIPQYRLFHIIVLGVISSYLLSSCQPLTSIPENDGDITIINISRHPVNSSNLPTNLVWVPDQANVLARVEENEQHIGRIQFYNLSNGERKEDYIFDTIGLNNAGITPWMHWSGNGKSIILEVVTWKTNPDNLFDILYYPAVAKIDASTHQGQIFLPPHGAVWNDAIVGISPDGRTALIGAQAKKTYTRDYYLLDLKTNEYSPLMLDTSKIPSDFSPLAWSSDEKWIAGIITEQFDLAYKSTIYLISMDGKVLQTVVKNVDGRVDEVAFSPDSRNLLFMVAKQGYQSIYVVSVNGDNLHEIFSGKKQQASIKTNLAWSSDGAKIAFISGDVNVPDAIWVLTLGKASSATSNP